MNKYEDIAKALKARLSELTRRLSDIDDEMHKPLPADSEERATYLENQDMFEGVENSGIQEIKQIREALKQIAEGAYGVCVEYPHPPDKRSLHARQSGEKL